MTPRERVLLALAHQPTDLVPIDLGGMRSTGISAVAYVALRRHLGLPAGSPRLFDLSQQLAAPELDLLDRLGGDVLPVERLCPAYGVPIDRWKPGTATDGSPLLVPEEYGPERTEAGELELRAGGRVLARMPAGGLYFSRVYLPAADAHTPEQIDRLPMRRLGEAELEFIRQQIARARSAGDRALMLGFGGAILEAGEDAFGFGRFMEALALEPALVHRYFERLSEGYLEDLRRLLDAVGGELDVIQFGDDLGGQEAPLISPRMYRAMIKPYHQRQYQLVHERCPHLRVFLHSCGAIRPFIPDLIESGVDILNPVQISARGMDPRELKREFGRSLVFWGGGADMQHTVPRASVEEIRAHVRGLVEIFSEGSGFVFAAIHNIQADVPPEKIVAIFEAARAQLPA